MPKMEGRESTQKQYDLRRLAVASFIMQHEEWLWRRKCCVKGCDHRMGPKTDEPGWIDWKSCDEKQLPAFVALVDREGYPDAGIACPHHVQEILDAEQVP